MGHRKHSQPRRGSLAYLPRKRAGTMEARIRSWPGASGEPRMLAHAGFKAGCVRIVSIDDREHTPNHGKQLVSMATVIATPPATVVGVRGYSRDHAGHHAEFDVYAAEMPKKVSKRLGLKSAEGALESARASLGRIRRIFALLAVTPEDASTGQKAPYVFEAAVGGGDVAAQFEYVSGLLGKEVGVDRVFEAGATVDVAAISRGKGWQGVIKRYGAKRKQHKSRKSVRELGSLGPISPQYVMYTVPRAGQMGAHQRIEYNKRIMAMGSAGEGDPINPAGGHHRFGSVAGDYVVLMGSVPGTPRRLVKLRAPMRPPSGKAQKPNILEVIA